MSSCYQHGTNKGIHSVVEWRCVLLVRVPLVPYPSSGVGDAGCAAAAVAATATTDAVAIVNIQQVYVCNNRQS